MRRLLIGLLGLALVLGGCGRPAAPGPKPSPGPEVPAPQNQGPPTQPTQPTAKSLIAAIIINGQPIEAQMLEVDPGSVEVVVSFTAPMNQGATEHRLRGALPDGATIEWTAPDRVILRLGPGRSFSIYAGDATTADGLAKDDGSRTVHVVRALPKRVRIFRPEALLAGGDPLLATNLAVPDEATFTISPDRSQALIYPSDPQLPVTPLSLIDLATGKKTKLTGAPSDHPFCWAGWGPDGRLLLLDVDGLWRVEADRLVRWSSPTKSFCWLANRSPDGHHLAVWGPFHLQLFDLMTGTGIAVPGEFRPMGQDGGVWPVWAPTSDRVALGDAQQSGIAGGPIETVLVGIDGQIKRRIPGWWPATWLPDGDLLVRRPIEGGHWTIARITPDGEPSPRPAGPDGSYSPDGRWVVLSAADGYRLAEVGGGRSVDLKGTSDLRWLADGTLLVVDK